MKKILFLLTLILLVTLTACKTETTIEIDELNVYGRYVHITLRKSSTSAADLIFTFKNITPDSDGSDLVFYDEMSATRSVGFFELVLENMQDYELVISSENADIITNYETIYIHTFMAYTGYNHSLLTEFLDDVIVPLGTMNNYTCLKEMVIDWEGTYEFYHQETTIIESYGNTNHRFIVVNPNEGEVFDLNIYQQFNNGVVEEFLQNSDGDWQFYHNSHGHIDTATSFIGIMFDDNYVYHIEKTKDTLEETVFVVTLTFNALAPLYNNLADLFEIRYIDFNGDETINVTYTLEYNVISEINFDFSRLLSVNLNEYNLDNEAKINYMFKDIDRTEEVVIPTNP